MEEIAIEATFAKRSQGWQEPTRDTHTFGGMTLTAAADFARSFAVLLDADSLSTGILSSRASGS
jgi:hypothetical protein